MKLIACTVNIDSTSPDGLRQVVSRMTTELLRNELHCQVVFHWNADEFAKSLNVGTDVASQVIPLLKSPGIHRSLGWRRVAHDGLG